MAGKQQWVVHPNRSELGPDEPGRNGHFRAVRTAPARLQPQQTCRARIVLPQQWSHLTDTDGAVTFAAPDWRSVACEARSFARHDLNMGEELPPPFGFRRSRVWWWWDGTTTTESILAGPHAAEHVRRYLAQMFPGAVIDVSDQRPPHAAF